MTDSPSASVSSRPTATAAAETESESAEPQPHGRRQPSRGWYLFAFALMILGVVAFLGSLQLAQSQVTASLDAMQRVVAPGSAEFTFTEPGDYLIYYEKVGTFEGQDFDTTAVFREAPAFDIKLQNNNTGAFAVIRQAKFDKSESQMFNHGRANSEFIFTLPPVDFADAADPVGYTITVAHENEGIDEPVLLAVGPPVVGSLMSDWRGPFGGAAALSFAFVVSATTVLVTWTLRNGKVTRRDD